MSISSIHSEKSDPNITPDAQFCLNDANIALITSDGWAYCVHKSVLRRLSVVFRDMFEDYSPPKSSKQPTKFNDLDVIEIPESHGVVRLFFAIVYNQKSVASIWNYAMLGKLMVFCNKYMIYSIMKHIVAHLRSRFPDSLDGYIKQIRGPSLEVADIVHITRAALEANLKNLLATGLYSLTVNREITTGYLTQFPRQLLVHYSHGLSKLSGLSRSQFANLHADLLLTESGSNTGSNIVTIDRPSQCAHGRSSHCNDLWRSTRAKISMLLAERYLNNPITLLLWYTENISTLVPDICNSCAEYLQLRFRDTMEGLWKSLPEAFAVGNGWEGLEYESEEEFELETT